MTLQIAERWFERKRLDDGITWLWEPHVQAFIRCNIWHVRGRDRDLMIDTGMGVASLREATRDLIDKKITAVATHTHEDHIGGLYEFEDCLVHAIEAANIANPAPRHALTTDEHLGAAAVQKLREAGYEFDEGPIITALPHADFDLGSFAIPAVTAVKTIAEGERIDTGDRSFEVLHLPGHSPGSIGLWEATTGTLFAGDALYDGPLLDTFEDGNIPDYIRTMHRLRALPVRVVHAGHEPSFGRARMIELIDAYLARREK